MKATKTNDGSRIITLTDSEVAGRNACWLVREHIKIVGEFPRDIIGPIKQKNGQYRSYEMTDLFLSRFITTYLFKDVAGEYTCWNPTAAEYRWEVDPFENEDYANNPRQYQYAFREGKILCRRRMIFTLNFKNPRIRIEDLPENISDNDFYLETRKWHTVITPGEQAYIDHLDRFISKME